MKYGKENGVKSTYTCHPERSVAPSKSEQSEDRIVPCTIRDLLKAEWQIPFCRSSKRGRFDFTKSAICRRFCKVRLRKHFPEMFSPLRMTQWGRLHFECLRIDTWWAMSCSIILYLLIRHGRAAPPSPQEKAQSKASLKQEGEKYL